MKSEAVAASNDALHAVLAAWLVRRDDCTPSDAVSLHGVQAIAAACEREGVVSLVHARLSESSVAPTVPHELLQALAARARMCAARSLLCVSEARRIQRVLDDSRIPAIWLKGIALGHWLYPSPHLRDFADIDLLLPDHATTLRAAGLLQPLGYALPNSHIAGDLVVHEILGWSESTRLELDLHWDLSNDALYAGRVTFEELFSRAVPLPGLGPQAAGLGPIDSFLHAVMHRSVNHLSGRQDRLRWLQDVQRLAASFGTLDWDGVAQLAREKELERECASALEAVRRVFTSDVSPVIRTHFTSSTGRGITPERLGNWWYFQWKTLQSLPGLQRWRWARQKLLPNLPHLAVRYGDGIRRTPIALLLVRRLVDGLSKLWRYSSS